MTASATPAATADTPVTTPGVKTRFAPSPTGYLHLGGARTALFSWAFARHHGGTFVLRIEDTDLERSTPEAVQAILEGMAWLDLAHDEGPHYQTQRFDRYKAVIAQMLEAGTAYRCWASPEEVEAMREQQRAAGLKPRYDGRWRPERAAAAGLVPPAGVSPVIRFRNPDDGVVQWDDLVKGPIAIGNAELDDFIIARADGTPTYNFCVVVDDWDMGITHVIRGDDHVNNTPRQVNVLRALGATVPVYGHVPMILGPDGEKLSKRHGAVSVIEYDAQGYLPEAMVNYLARLGWSHGDDELFSREQLVSWFDPRSISKGAAQIDFDKLRWVNAHWIKQLAADDLAARVAPRLLKRGFDAGALAAAGQGATSLATVCALVRDRAQTLEEIADLAAMCYETPAPAADELAKQLPDERRPALAAFADTLEALPDWTPEAVAGALKAALAQLGLKMPQLAIPVRLVVFGRAQTPSVDAMLAAMPRALVLSRLRAAAA